MNDLVKLAIDAYNGSVEKYSMSEYVTNIKGFEHYKLAVYSL